MSEGGGTEAKETTVSGVAIITAAAPAVKTPEEIQKEWNEAIQEARELRNAAMEQAAMNSAVARRAAAQEYKRDVAVIEQEYAQAKRVANIARDAALKALNEKPIGSQP